MKTALLAALVSLVPLAGAAAARLAQERTPTMQELKAQTRPGPEHERLGALAGEWGVALVARGSERPSATVAAEVRALLGGRFVDVSGALGEGEGRREFRFTLGFDRRHDEFTLTLLDSSGTYGVTARGPDADGVIRMRGVDDDPYMASLGLEKKYAFDLLLAGEDAFGIRLHFVDTRQEEEPLLEQYTYAFERR